MRRFTTGKITLHDAVFAGDRLTAERLLRDDADPNARDPEGHTPLTLAAMAGDESLTVLLLDVGARPDEGGDASPLHWAARRGHEGVVRALLARGASVNPPDEASHHCTPLGVAGAAGHAAVVRLLLEAGASPSMRCGRLGATPLFWAADAGHVPVVRLLLDAGADPEARDTPGGFTPLHRAARNGRTEAVRELARAGAALNARHLGFTPLDMAEGARHEETARLLASLGAKRAKPYQG